MVYFTNSSLIKTGIISFIKYINFVKIIGLQLYLFYVTLAISLVTDMTTSLSLSTPDTGGCNESEHLQSVQQPGTMCYAWCFQSSNIWLSYELEKYTYLTGLEMITDSNTTQVEEVTVQFSADAVNWTTFSNTDFSHTESLVCSLTTGINYTLTTIVLLIITFIKTHYHLNAFKAGFYLVWILLATDC